MRPDMKIDWNEISNRFEFCFRLHEKVISRWPENSCVWFPCKIMLVHFENKYGEEKQHGKSIIINRYIKYITTCSFRRKQYSITFRLIMLLIKKRNFLVKQSESIFFETYMGNVFCILCNFIVHFVIWCVLFYKLKYVRRFTWDYDPFQKQPPKVFYKKAVLKNFAIFTGKHLCWSLFLINLQDSRLKKEISKWNSQNQFFLKRIWEIYFVFCVTLLYICVIWFVLCFAN